VSVGETRAALPLIRALLDRYPDLPLLVTTTTLTGSRQVPRGAGRTAFIMSTRLTTLPGAVAAISAARPAQLGGDHGNRVVAESAAAMRDGRYSDR
jgi:hypothetical protein